MVEITYTAPDEEAMVALGAKLAGALSGGLTVYLNGDLGMGKTTLARGIVQASGHEGAVKSPTYTLVEPYELEGLTIYHFDLYRLGSAEELEFMGIRDYFGPHSLALLEWPERGQGILPPGDLVITIERQGLGRSVTIYAATSAGVDVLSDLGGGG
ncbi:MAG: tRNA (adenosine(37)-N6)-threonylcarbamoyltransferase complex ATPase subunit type 1 TsaE [Halioglobus sp.]